MATSQNEGVGLGEQGQQEKQLANLLDVVVALLLQKVVRSNCAATQKSLNK